MKPDQGEHTAHGPAAVLSFVDEEQKTEVADQREQDAGVGQAQRRRHAGHGGAEQQRERQQRIGVAQHPVRAQGGGDAGVCSTGAVKRG